MWTTTTQSDDAGEWDENETRQDAESKDSCIYKHNSFIHYLLLCIIKCSLRHLPQHFRKSALSQSCSSPSCTHEEKKKDCNVLNVKREEREMPKTLTNDDQFNTFESTRWEIGLKLSFSLFLLLCSLEISRLCIFMFLSIKETSDITNQAKILISDQKWAVRATKKKPSEQHPVSWLVLELFTYVLIQLFELAEGISRCNETGPCVHVVIQSNLFMISISYADCLFVIKCKMLVMHTEPLPNWVVWALTEIKKKQLIFHSILIK